MDKLEPAPDDATPFSAHEGEVFFTPEEIAGIEEARADAKLRGTIPAEEVFAWLDSLDTDKPLPKSQPRKSPDS